MRTITEIQREIDGADRRAGSIAAEALAIYTAAGLDLSTATHDDFQAMRGRMTAGQLEAEKRYRAGTETLLSERDGLRRELIEAEAVEDAERLAYLRAQAAKPGMTEGPSTFTNPTPNRGTHTMIEYAAASPAAIKAAAFAAIEKVGHPAAQDRLDHVIRAESEGTPANARYLAAVASDVYAEAWRRVISDPDRAAVELDPAERAALREARNASSMLNMVALGTLDGGSGWPLPLQVDPSLIITGDGVADPLRRLATVRTIVSKQLTVVTAAQVAAGYGAEGTDVTVATPAPAPAPVIAERGSAFVRLTFELLQDLAGAVTEIARIFEDAKANLEGQKFAIGSGTDEPGGIVTGLTPFAGTPADPDDLRAAQSDLGPRYSGAARWLGNLGMLNTLSTFVASADASEPQIFDAAGNLLRKPTDEVSYLPDGAVIYGSVRQGFLIVDRLGMSLEPTGVTFNKDTGIPDGHRGFLALWRSGSGVIDPEALRLLWTEGS